MDNYLNLARKYDPEGCTCGFCGSTNDFADDCGFFYACPEGKEAKPVCSSCWNSDVGTKHVARWGLGAR